MARGIEVDRTDYFTLTGFNAGSNHVGVVQAQNGRHATHTRGHGFLHQLPATLDQLDRIGKADAAGGDQRAVFTQAVAGHIGRLNADFGLPQAPQGDGSGQDGRLGLVGLVEQLYRALLGQGPQVVTQGSGRFSESIDHQRMLRALLGEHGQGLGTLPRKDECEGCRH